VSALWQFLLIFKNSQSTRIQSSTFFLIQGLSIQTFYEIMTVIF